MCRYMALSPDDGVMMNVMIKVSIFLKRTDCRLSSSVLAVLIRTVVLVTLFLSSGTLAVLGKEDGRKKGRFFQGTETQDL